MKICVWRTGHEIADTVAEAVLDGLNTRNHRVSICTMGENIKYLVKYGDIHIGYGILRGMDKVFKACQATGKPFIHIDKGYWKPGHFTGYYRISLNGTQQTLGLDKLEPDYARWDALGVGQSYQVDRNGYSLWCPPTDHVSQFFDVKDWSDWALKHTDPSCIMLREKGTDDPIIWGSVGQVITFNSSVGWEALRRGLPVVSDATHSIVGAYQKLMDKPLHMDYDARKRLFAIMSSLQLTLAEIKAGAIWPVIQKLITYT